ncbi:MAG: Fis family transcriptional regulator [Rhodospirillales bacterium 70-18]|nr:sigma-54-dependent Fis family transcriptional regulator [Rhodospirillales bacterium]OJY65732.1 MAG: Fis family transcriptional regulator [Rhodospirillales bacterium 70-18]
MAYEMGLVGEHPSVAETRRLIARVARSPARTVLLYGETGTGKGLVARMLHQQSARAGRGFVDVNCAAIPENLLESELFGHERGAFTGALAKKIGLVETADRGTLFLDEIREMTPVLQAKLLTLLDTLSFRRVGDVRAIHVDARVVASTNKILLSEVKAGKFREDLYYRLQVVAINIPALRERGDDVFILAEHFMRKFSARYERVITGFDPEVRDIFRRYPWPGNVRELENLIERIFILEDDPRILVRHLPARILRDAADPTAADDAGEAAPQGFEAATQAFQQRLVRRALAEGGGNLGQAARLLGLSRHALRHQMLKLGMR